MFERFTGAARQTVVGAQYEAGRLHHGYIGTEHLLLGILRGDVDAGPAARALDVFAIRLEDVRRDVEDLIGAGPESGDGSDAEALRSIGIDLDEVKRRVEEAFGPGALDRRTVRGRRRGRCEPRAGHTPFTPRAKKVLETSVREARALGDDRIETAHLLLALVRERKGLASQILTRRGATEERLRPVVLAELGRNSPGRSA
jgi:ATP-dependent Clp protease ATP-binding subunit ClpA